MNRLMELLAVVAVMGTFAGSAAAQQQQQYQPDGFYIRNGQVTTWGQGSVFSWGPNGTTSADQTGGWTMGPNGFGDWSGPVAIGPDGQPVIVPAIPTVPGW